MKIILFEPYNTGSHAQWALELKAISRHQIELFTLPGRHWKWRMHGSAISLYQAFKKSRHFHDADLLVATSMCDLSIIRALLHKEGKQLPTAMYFHENQLSYPWSPNDQDPKRHQDRHYGFIQISSALSADHCFFNTEWHRQQFIHSVKSYLEVLPDHRLPDAAEAIDRSSSCLHLGIHLSELISAPRVTNHGPATILWNHRHDYDKNPETFFKGLFACAEAGFDFQLIVTGRENDSSSPIFKKAQARLTNRIIHWGHCESREKYHRLLLQSDILPVSSQQDFFGISVVEAMAAGCYPLLPEGLAYREHEPSDIYYHHGDFEEKLKELLTSNTWQEGYRNRPQLMRYDWSMMGPASDTAFEKIVLEGSIK